MVPPDYHQIADLIRKVLNVVEYFKVGCSKEDCSMVSFLQPLTSRFTSLTHLFEGSECRMEPLRLTELSKSAR